MISQEVRPSDRLRFSIEVMSDFFTYDTDEPECVIRLVQIDRGAKRLRKSISSLMDKGLFKQYASLRRTLTARSSDDIVAERPQSPAVCDERIEQTTTIALWDLTTFQERLQHFREIYENFHREHMEAADFTQLLPEYDPWVQLSCQSPHAPSDEERSDGDDGAITPPKSGKTPGVSVCSLRDRMRRGATTPCDRSFSSPRASMPSIVRQGSDEIIKMKQSDESKRVIDLRLELAEERARVAALEAELERLRKAGPTVLEKFDRCLDRSDRDSADALRLATAVLRRMEGARRR